LKPSHRTGSIRLDPNSVTNLKKREVGRESGKWGSGGVGSGGVEEWEVGEWRSGEWRSGEWGVEEWRSGGVGSGGVEEGVFRVFFLLTFCLLHKSTTARISNKIPPSARSVVNF